MKSLESMTLEELAKIGNLNPMYARMAERMLVGSYDDFIRVFYGDIDSCITEIERNRELRQDSSEDLLSVEIISMLKVIGYTATHEAKSGGHVDITVSHAKGYEWFGEAKKHSSYDHLFEGFLQLCTRYSTGSPDSKCGGIIAYVNNQDVAKVITTWKERLKSENLPDYTDWDCKVRSGLSFFSRHKHEVSGLPYTVRHMAVMMYHAPKDKSARNRGKAK